ncbi:hypothetical protein JR316_0000054 [Psilocybe cubensis]|uniref:Uncharacterized protein n=2 Tax=Psilocybe cubensis TaxID=181762 RepID=A0A8H8CPW5_PSICU|nr:hypothetical protein JR316_0000054 [Psilocybe cubensis]KAH9485991.1 hypothetical protein JR316_0000054 [Psilocybe cubensis]
MPRNFDNLPDVASTRARPEGDTPPLRTDKIKNHLASFFGGATVDLRNCTFIETSGDVVINSTSEAPQSVRATPGIDVEQSSQSSSDSAPFADSDTEGAPSFFVGAKNVTIFGGEFTRTVVKRGRYTTTTAVVSPDRTRRTPGLRTESRDAPGTSTSAHRRKHHRDRLPKRANDSDGRSDGVKTCIVSQDENGRSVLWVPT